MLPHLSNAPSGFRACPCTRPGGWEGSSWDLQAMTLQSPAAEDWGGHCLQRSDSPSRDFPVHPWESTWPQKTSRQNLSPTPGFAKWHPGTVGIQGGSGGAEPAKLVGAAWRGAAVAPSKAGQVPTGPTRCCCHLTALGETAFCDSAVFIPACSPAQRGFPWKTSIQNKEREGATAGVTQPQLEASASEAGKGGLFPMAWSCSSSRARGWSWLSPARVTVTSQAGAQQV